MIAFAKQYDPQWFHQDAEAAVESHFGGLIASGIHVLALWRQMDHEINSDIDFVCGVGWDEVRMTAPLFVGDTLYAESEVLEKRESKSRPDQGIVTFKTVGKKQDGTMVSHYKRTVLVWKRGHGPADD